MPTQATTMAMAVAASALLLGCPDATPGLPGSGGGHAGHIGTSSSSGSGGSDPKWGCIGHVSPLPKGKMTTVSVQLLDAVTMKPVTDGITIKRCAKLDFMCSSALDTPVVDSMGNVSMVVASDFDGYLEVEDSTKTYPTSLVYLDLVAVSENPEVGLVTNTDIPLLAKAAGIQPVPGSGFLVVPTVDCTGARTAGVSVTMSPPSGSTYYVIDNSPKSTATETDSGGNAGFANVYPGVVTVKGTFVPSGEEFGQVTTNVRSDAMTWQLLRPTPTP
jgi:hypothetical protein